MEALYYYVPALESVRDFLELGGNVLFLIGFVTLVMWAFIFERVLYLRNRHGYAVNTAMDIWEGRAERKSWYAHQIRNRLISTVSLGLEKNIPIINTCVALCPLMGL